MPRLKLYFLQASRSIRIAWLLEELGLDYDVQCYERENNKAPSAFKKESGNSLGKAPVLWDGELVLTESGAISEYLCEKYDATHRLFPLQEPERSRVREWIHAAEGTFLIHALAITYSRWNLPASAKEDGTTLEGLERGLAASVQKDFDWLASELQKNGGRFLVGNEITCADTMVFFSIDFILARGLGVQGKHWPAIDAWLDACRNSPGYRRAVEKTGHRL